MYIIGDTHGLRPVFSIIDKHKLQDQNLIHVGDLGLGFVSIEQDINNLKTIDEMLIETNNHLYVIRGNHDNPIFWNKSKGLNLPKLHNFHLVDDYTVIKIENKNILFVGGAISIDRRPRMDDVPYPSWWADEIFKYDKIKLDKAIANLNVDIVITHTAPSFCYPKGVGNVDIVDYYHVIEAQHGIDLKQELMTERLQVSMLYHDLTSLCKQNPTHWFYGHFHSTKKQKIDNIEFNLLNINELYKVN